jgi:hypothetical protein
MPRVDPGEAFVGWTETHDVGEIQGLLAAGLDPNAPIRGRTPIEWMIEMYMRSPRFPECMRALVGAGAEIRDPALRAVLLDDAGTVTSVLEHDPGALGRRYSLVTTYALLSEASLLHVAAEFGVPNATRALIEAGADLEAPAAIDEYGLGGQTPIFHTVNSNLDHCARTMHVLLGAGARTDVHLEGLRWGVGFPWETTLYDLTPIGFAQCGLLPQFQRDAEQIYDNIEALLAAEGRPVPPRTNVPNAYLNGKTAPDA